MAHDTPDLPELVRTAREFVDSIVAKLDGQDRYHALCVTYLLDIVLRELGEWRPLETDDDRRLQALIGDAKKRSGTELLDDLSRKIRDGQFDDRMELLLGELLEHVTSKVRVSKPSYLDE